MYCFVSNIYSVINFLLYCFRRSEFLGCVSFPIKDAINCDISGTYFLQQGSGRGQNAAQAHSNDRFVREDRVTEGDTRKMATDNIETSTNDGKENHNDKGEVLQY